MSDSPKEFVRVRVRSTFELADPLCELPPDPDCKILSPNTIRQKQKEIDDLLKNAKCEDGMSMDSIATYIPSKATLKKREEEAKAVAAAAEEERLAKIAAQIAYHEAAIASLKRGSIEEVQLDKELEKLSITRPTSVFAEDRVINSEQHTRSNWASRNSSDSITMVTSPTIGALAAAPPAMGALMGAPPGVGAMVVAALQPGQAQVKLMEGGEADDSSLSDDFQIVHDEFKQPDVMEKACKKQR
ncbi:hypothetical protein L3Y34_011942 [Caenorhabditis briggsae]|uniref:Uncharacterized protein n=2 Tax=Caenorhabditis briggsae TaxID=6238 RepID=A0AAE8ZSQ6_CAEBR|nr:hypothetical protein L3Y34_011942 [Caenorhabditis briggsae]